jgi:hypothetical protein
VVRYEVNTLDKGKLTAKEILVVPAKIRGRLEVMTP